MGDILKEAIADAKAVRETALQNAKMALEEAFTPQIKSMLSAKLKEDEMGDEEEVPMEDEMGDEEEVPAEEGYYEDEEAEEEIPVAAEDEMGDEEVPMEDEMGDEAPADAPEPAGMEMGAPEDELMETLAREGVELLDENEIVDVVIHRVATRLVNESRRQRKEKKLEALAEKIAGRIASGK